MKRVTLPKSAIFLSLATVFLTQGALLGSTYTASWSGCPIVGDDQYPDTGFMPSGSAVFKIEGTQLTITLTNSSAMEITAIGQVLTGLTWDNPDSDVVLNPLTAVIHSGSRLVNLLGVPDPGTDDLSPEWAFKSNIDAGLAPLGPLGSFGVGTMGDINFGADTFGAKHLFDPDPHHNLFGPVGLNGIEVGVVGENVDFDNDGFTTQGPVVQGFSDNPGEPKPGQMLFTFEITEGILTAGEIENVQPLFGTDGAPLAPEPLSSIVWLLIGVTWAGSAWMYRYYSQWRKLEQEAVLATATSEGTLALRDEQARGARSAIRAETAVEQHQVED